VLLRVPAYTTKDMADFDKEKLHYFSFNPKLEKPIKAVIRHLPTHPQKVSPTGWLTYVATP